MKVILFLSIVFLSLNNLSYSQRDKEIYGYLISNNGEKVDSLRYKPFSIYSFRFCLKNEKGEWKPIKQKNYRRAVVDGHLWIRLDGGSGYSDRVFHEIIATSESHFISLIRSEENREYLYVWDRSNYESGKYLGKRIMLMPRNSNQPTPKRIKKYIQMLNEKIFVYFQSCPYIAERMTKNLEDYYTINSGFANYKCNEVKGL